MGTILGLHERVTLEDLKSHSGFDVVQVQSFQSMADRKYTASFHGSYLIDTTLFSSEAYMNHVSDLHKTIKPAMPAKFGLIGDVEYGWIRLDRDRSYVVLDGKPVG